MKELQRAFVGTARSEDAGVVGGQPRLCRKKDFHGFRFGASAKDADARQVLQGPPHPVLSSNIF